VNELIKQISTVLKSSQLQVGSNQSTTGEMRRLRNRLRGMKWFLVVEIPSVAVLILVVTISNLISEPLIYFAFTTILVFMVFFGNLAVALVLLPKRSLCSRKKKTESYASYVQNTNTNLESST